MSLFKITMVETEENIPKILINEKEALEEDTYFTYIENGETKRVHKLHLVNSQSKRKSYSLIDNEFIFISDILELDKVLELIWIDYRKRNKIRLDRTKKIMDCVKQDNFVEIMTNKLWENLKKQGFLIDTGSDIFVNEQYLQEDETPKLFGFILKSAIETEMLEQIEIEKPELGLKLLSGRFLFGYNDRNYRNTQVHNYHSIRYEQNIDKELFIKLVHQQNNLLNTSDFISFIEFKDMINKELIVKKIEKMKEAFLLECHYKILYYTQITSLLSEELSYANLEQNFLS